MFRAYLVTIEKTFIISGLSTQSNLVIRNAVYIVNNLAIMNYFPRSICQLFFINSEQPGVSEQFCDDQKFLITKFVCTISFLIRRSNSLRISMPSAKTTKKKATVIIVLLWCFFNFSGRHFADGSGNLQELRSTEFWLLTKSRLLAV